MIFLCVSGFSTITSLNNTNTIQYIIIYNAIMAELPRGNNFATVVKFFNIILLYTTYVYLLLKLHKESKAKINRVEEQLVLQQLESYFLC